MQLCTYLRRCQCIGGVLEACCYRRCHVADGVLQKKAKGKSNDVQRNDMG